MDFVFLVRTEVGNTWEEFDSLAIQHSFRSCPKTSPGESPQKMHGIFFLGTPSIHVRCFSATYEVSAAESPVQVQLGRFWNVECLGNAYIAISSCILCISLCIMYIYIHILLYNIYNDILYLGSPSFMKYEYHRRYT